MTDLVEGIVRGPEPYFHTDGVLYPPGAIVMVPADQVGDKPTKDEVRDVETKSGNMRKVTIKRKVKFAPVGSAPTINQPVSTAEVATGQPDRLNVSDFLKGGLSDIEAAIASGSVDDALGVIEQAEISGKNRKGVKDAIIARSAALHR